MSVKISGEEAYQTYDRLKLRKPGGQKASTLDNITTILKDFQVEVNPKPIDPVSFTEFENSITTIFFV